jgi:hypothetical protein
VLVTKLALCVTITVIAIVQSKIQKDQYNTACARRKFLNVNTVVLDPVLNHNVFCAVKPDGLTPAFASDPTKQQQWTAFIQDVAIDPG